MQKKTLILSALSILFFLFGSIKIFGQQKQVPFSPALHGNVDGYLEYLPADYNTSTKTYPLILFLHGSGEAGSQGPLSLVAKNGPPELIAAGQFPASVTVNGQTFSFIVISPQFINWPVAADVDAMLQYVESHYRVDLSRIYLTGLSMGGGATWDYAQQSQYGSKLAAISVIAGAQPPSVSGGCTIAGEKMGVWAFNNIIDPNVSPAYTTDWISYINACNPPVPALHTVFNASGHGGWVTAYDPNYKGTDVGSKDYGLNMYQWFLQFQKGGVTTAPPPTNQAPVANAGANQSITLPANTVTLNGSGSSDPDGSIVSYAWSLVSGPAGYTFGGSTAAQPIITGLTTAGTYVYSLSVKDNLGLLSLAVAKVTITVNPLLVPNHAPVANAGSAQSITLPSNSVTLNGSASADPDGTISSYAWTLLSGPSGYTFTGNSTANPIVGSLIAGSYVFQLTVKDNLGLASAPSKVAITVNPAVVVNHPPVASTGAAQTIKLPANSLTLDGSGSTDPDGTVESYSWSLVSGPSGYSFAGSNTAKTILNNLIAGVYSFKLTVTDNSGASTSAAVSETVNAAAAPGNQMPVAAAGTSQTITLPSNSITLDGSGSSDPDGSINSYSWSLVSGPSGYNFAGSTAVKSVVSNLVAGVYTFKLSVTDNSGATSSAQVSETVDAAVVTTPPPAPVGGGKTITLIPDANRVIGIDDVSKTLNPQPGDTLCFLSGDYSYVYLGNIHGTADKPIILKNCGGLVRIGVNQNYTVTFQIYKSSYFKLQGTGDPSIEYGFDISGVKTGGGNSDAITLDRGDSDFELNNLYIHDASHFIVSEQRADCADPQWWRENYTMKNISFHHIKGNNSVFEGFYIGPTSFTTTGPCGIMNNNLIENMQVYDNIVTNTGNAAIQVAMAWLGTNVVHHNYIKNFGTSNSTFQTNGMEIGGGVKADVYDNIIDTGIGNGMQVLGGGLCRVYNNIVISPGADGIQIGQRILFQPLQAQLVNNTIINAGVKSISVYDTIRPNPHQLYNNLLVHQGSTFNRGVVGIDATPQVADMQNNLYLTNVSDGDFVNAATGDYHLGLGSPAIDKGKNVTSLGYTSDYDGKARPYNGIYDVGAYEYTGVGKANHNPLANAGKDQTITLPLDSVLLDGSASTDPDKNIKSYGWGLVSGPGGFSYSGNNLSKTEVTKLIAGTYVFQLTVTDSLNAVGTDQVTVTVNPSATSNKPPVAKGGANQTITLPVNSITLDGSTSADPDGSITKYAWTLISGPSGFSFVNSSLVKTQVNSLIAGNYVFQLQVTDNQGATSTVQIKVTVNPSSSTNQPPIAVAGPNQTIQLPVSTVTLDGSGSHDPDGTVIKYYWSLVSGPEGYTYAGSNDQKPVITGLLAGTYVYRLSVVDNMDAFSAATSWVTITVLAPAGTNQPPSANAGDDQVISLPQNSVSLDGSASFDSDGNIVSYEWSLMSGPKGFTYAGSNLSQPTVNNLIVGGYIFQLKVTDNQNAVAYSSVHITVNDSVYVNGPNVVVTADTTVTLPLNSTVLNGSRTTDVGGTITHYQWSYVSGPSVYNMASSDSSRAILSNLQPGTYVFELTVTNAQGASNTATETIHVLPGSASVDNVLLYPNPGNGVFNVRLSYVQTGNTLISVYNTLGNLVRSIQFSKDQPNFLEIIDLTNIASGIYILNIQTGSIKHSVKVIKY